MAFVTWGGNYCIAQETAYKTLSFPDDNKNNNKLSAYDKSWIAKIGDFSWKITNFNNNNWKNSWTYIKAGSKKFASVATIDNTTPFDKAIGKIVVGVEKDVEARFVNSICLQVASDANFSNVIETVKLIYYKKTDFVFNVSAPQANLYYRLKFDLKQGSGNGFVQINKVEYYEDASNKTATSLSFDAPSYTISKDQTFTKLPTLKAGEQTLSDKTITWSSDNDKVATVDAATGTVTGVAAGKANITAKFAGDDTYKTSKASYEIIVKGAPSLSFPQTSYTVEMSDVFSTPKLEGLPEGVTPAYTSSNTEVATVDATTGEVTIVGVGTTTITVTSPNTDIYEEATASYELNVKAGIYKVVFDFTTNNWNLPTSYVKDKASYTNEAGYTITFGKSGNGHRFNKSDTAEPIPFLIFGKKDATLSLPAFPFAVSKIKIFGNANASGRVQQNIFVGEEAVSTETKSAKEDHVYEIADAYQAAGNIYTIKVTNDNNTRISKIVVYAKNEILAGSINIATEEGYGTFYTDKNYVLPQGLTAFAYTSVNGDNSLNKSEEYVAGDIVPANTAVVVKGAKGSYNYYNTEEAATKTIEKNLLKGVTTDTRIEATSGVKRYILTRADDGILAFYRTNTGNINVKANRAYLEVPTAMAVASFSLEGSATGINNIVTTAAKQGIYTIFGVRLNATTTKELPAGIYIVDGKKVIVK